jgi:hypothetical protein
MRTHALEQGYPGEEPSVFGVEDDVNPLFTMVDLRLADQLNLEGGFPVGLIVPEEEDDIDSIRAALNDPRTGVANFVLTTPQQPGDPKASADTEAIEEALRLDGYRQVRELALPDGSSIDVWWRSIRDAVLVER